MGKLVTLAIIFSIHIVTRVFDHLN